MDGNTEAQSGADQQQTADQATLQAAADQNGTATGAATAAQTQQPAAAEDASQADDELVAAFAAFKEEVETLTAAVGVIGDRITAVEDGHAKLDARIAALEAADLPAHDDAPLAARVTALEVASQEAEAAAADLTVLEGRVAELEQARQAAPPDAEIVGALVKEIEGRLNTLTMKLRHIL